MFPTFTPNWKDSICWGDVLATSTGLDRIPITDRARLLSDNGPGYVSRAFRDYLGMVGHQAYTIHWRVPSTLRPTASLSVTARR